MKERNYKYIAIAYMRLHALRKQLDDLRILLLALGSYPDDYSCYIESISYSIQCLEEKLEFKYK